MMNTFTLKNNKKIPSLGYGTWKLKNEPEIEEIVAQAELYKGRKISMMYDMDNILEHEKSAPIDEGLDKWNKLVESYIFPISLDDEDYED